MRKFAIAILAGLALSSAAPGLAKGKDADVAAAVASPDRPDGARMMDEGRKPAQVLAFLGLKLGASAADLISGTGYWAEIMAKAVGPKGHVVAYEPEQFYNDPKSMAAWDELLAREPNVSVTRYPFEAFTAPAGSLDFAIINLSYHDLYWESEKFKIPRTDPAAYVKALYAAMKPGGVVGVIDHVGMPGDTRETVDKLHRIDPEVVKADWIAAGFKLEGSSDMLANPEDDHSKLVFDPAIRGKTDRFLFKFRKPK